MVGMFDPSKPAGSQRAFDFPPEVWAELVNMGVVDEQGNIIDQQLAEAVAMRHAQPQRYITGLGGALGAAGDVLQSGISYAREAALRRQQQKDIIEPKKSAYLAIAKALRGEAPPEAAVAPVAPTSISDADMGP